jgi:hypothetical protein
MSLEVRFAVPDEAGLIFVVAGVAVAAVAAMILRRRTERREMGARLRTKQLSVDVIRSSEELRAGAVAPEARLVGDTSGYRAAVRGLRASTCSTNVKATLSDLEQARQQVLLAVLAHDVNFLQNAVHGLDEALENFATASSVMVRLA